MSAIRSFAITFTAMLAFAGNSLLCRMALSSTPVDAASFTSLRLISGAAFLYFLVSIRQRKLSVSGNWLSALALFAYAAGFSFAYVNLTAATGALLLFGAVQATMIGYGLSTGERINVAQVTGVVLAIVGLVVLLLPGARAPSFAGSVLMTGAGVAWGVYSLRGRGNTNPVRATAGNFLYSVPFAILLSMIFLRDYHFDVKGFAYAVASGAIASGLGYALWYTALPALSATTAAIVQLSVPAIAAIGAVIFLDEAISNRLWIASLLILGGIAIFIFNKRRTVNA